jgi:hypothetical protein
MFTTQDSVSVEVLTDDIPRVDVDPRTYVSNIPASSHLAFERPLGLESIKSRMDSINEVKSENPPAEIVIWLESKLESLQAQIDGIIKEVHERNARLLAERVIHKFQKWGPFRFGENEHYKSDFYDGSSRIDTDDNPITFDLSFETQVRELATQAGLDRDQVLTNLHIGRTCAQRFSEFIHVNIPKLHDEEDSEIEEDQTKKDQVEEGIGSYIFY